MFPGEMSCGKPGTILPRIVANRSRAASPRTYFSALWRAIEKPARGTTGAGRCRSYSGGGFGSFTRSAMRPLIGIACKAEVVALAVLMRPCGADLEPLGLAAVVRLDDAVDDVGG